jgi:hypothetical protein
MFEIDLSPLGLTSGSISIRFKCFELQLHYGPRRKDEERWTISPKPAALKMLHETTQEMLQYRTSMNNAELIQTSLSIPGLKLEINLLHYTE